MTPQLLEEKRTESIIGAFFEVYNTLGFGFLESAYVRAMRHELALRGHAVVAEAPVRVSYKGQRIGLHRIDLLVDETIIVEIKSSEILSKAADRQLLHYLRGTGLHVGLLLHFGPAAKFHRRVA